MNHRRDEFHESPSSPAFHSERLILFTRYPTPGQTKTRLIPVLGAEGAARLQRRLTLRTLRSAEALQAARGANLEIHFDGATEPQMQHWLGDRFKTCPQANGDLGQRLAWAFDQSFRDGSHATIIIGSDCPGLASDVLSEAFATLSEHPVVIGPANDGGYYLIGLRRPVPQLFSGISWGSSTVLAESLRILEKLSFKPALLQPLDDIDRPEDLSHWRRLLEAEDADLGNVSVIIPALNESQQIRATIAAAAAVKPMEIIVVDGESSDETVRSARQAGATVLVSAPGRARQMNAGAAKAGGDVLLFLHADTLLPEGYSSAVVQALRRPGIAAAAFRFAVAETFAGSKLLEWATNLRSRWLQMPYGDQALSIRRALFEELGGFADLPILEDYELVRRLHQCGRVITLPISVGTSGRRWQRLGLVRTALINKRVIIGYRLGWPIEKLAATYRQAGLKTANLETRSPKTQ